MSNDKVEWEAPEAVIQWQREETKKEIVHYSTIATKVGWPVWALACIPAYIYGPLAYGDNFRSWFTYFVAVGILFPPLFPFLISAQAWSRLRRSHTIRYEIDHSGIIRHEPSMSAKILWKHIFQYQFLDHPTLEKIRILEIIMTQWPNLAKDRREQNNGGIRYRFYVDTNVVNESEVDVIIQQSINKIQ